MGRSGRPSERSVKLPSLIAAIHASALRSDGLPLRPNYRGSPAGWEPERRRVPIPLPLAVVLPE